MNKQKILTIISNLKRELDSFEGEVKEDWICKTITGEPMIVHSLHGAVIGIMPAAAENNK